MVFNNSILLGAAGQSGKPTFDPTLIGNSVWLDGSSDQLEMAKTSGGSASSKFTVSCWVQRNEFTESPFAGIFGHFFSSNTGVQLYWSSDDKLNWIVFSSVSGSGGSITSSGVFRDIAWYHILANYDGTNGRMELFVNGESVGVDTFTASSTNPIGSGTSGAAYYWGAIKNTAGTFGRTNSYLAQCALELGTAAVPSDYVDTFTFGTNGSQVIPKKSSELVSRINSAGGHSHLLDFADSSDLGNDISSNNNDFTATSMSSANQSVHTPSKVYAAWNPLRNFASSAVTLSDGNLKMSAGDGPVLATKAIPSTGKWVVTGEVNAGDFTLGVATESVGTSKLGSDAKGFALVDTGANLLSRTNNTDTNSTSALSVGDKVIAAFDADTGKLWLGSDTGSGYTYLGGGNPATGATPTFTISSTETLYFAGGSAGNNLACDFGQNNFDGTVPSGFESLNSTTLTAPDFQGIDYFDATIYEGNGTGQRVGDFVPFTDIGTISQSVAFNLADSDKLTIASSVSTTPTNVQKKTISVWLKPWKVGENFIMVGVNGSESERIYTTSTGQLQYLTRNSSSTTAHVSTNGAFVADASQWVHVVFGIDYTDGSTEADRVKIYVNGVQITDLANTNYPANNMTSEAYINKASTEQIIGKHPSTSGGDATNFSDMYYAEYYMVDGLQLTPSTFGQLDTSTNRWVAKSTSTVTSAISSAGGFGNCGFYLNFSNTSDYGEDSSGNNRDFTESGVLDATNQVKDTPSKNYAIYDTVKGAVYTAMSLSKGGLTTKDGNGSVALAAGFPIQDGYWYYEVNTVEDVNNMVFGLYNPATTVTASTSNPSLSGIQVSGATIVMQNNGGSNSAAGPTLSNPSAGDVVGIYIRKVGNSYGMWFSLNGTAMSNTPAATETATPDISFMASIELVPAVHYSNPGTKEAQTNFGQLLQFDGGATSFNAASDGYWKHAPVTGFKALNQDNLDDTSSKLTALAWIKNRDADDSHILVDRVRGVGKVLHSNNPGALETTEPNTVQRFFQRGVQVGNDVQVNTANESYVLWQWLVGDSATTGTAISADNPPSIASTVIAADAGHFSVGTYTGQTSAGTVGHGLGGAPEMIIIWDKEFDNSIAVYHKFLASDAETDYLLLNGTGLPLDDATFWNDTAPNSTVFSVGTGNNTNGNGRDKLFLAFRSIPGVCKLGSYTGNGNSSGDGPYISTGFKPKWIFIRRYDSTTDAAWWTLDTVRDNDGNPTNHLLRLNTNGVEGANNSSLNTDFLSDGFKPRSNYTGINANNGTYIYMAMADIGGNGTLPPIYGR